MGRVISGSRESSRKGVQDQGGTGERGGIIEEKGGLWGPGRWFQVRGEGRVQELSGSLGADSSGAEACGKQHYKRSETTA